MAKTSPRRVEAAHEQSLDERADYVLQEARVVLPGIQALFGFQLIAVFSDRFHDLAPVAQNTHLAALLFLTVAIALVMAPPIFHRVADQGSLTRRFVDMAARCIAWAMGPLAIAITLEIGLVAWVVSGSLVVAVVVGGCAALLFLVLWLIYPWTRRKQRSGSS